MIKVFDYECPKRGWIAKDSYADAKKFVLNTFRRYWTYDRDNCCTCYMEIYNDGKHEVWVAELGTWFEYEDADFSYYYGSRKDFPGVEFTKLNPRVDYIFV